MDPTDEHPLAVWIALCGHRMLTGELRGEPFGGSCGHCAGLVAASRVPAGRVIRWVRDPASRCHAVTDPHADELMTLCKERLPAGELVAEPRPSGLVCLRCLAGEPVHPQPRRLAVADEASLVRRIESGGALSRPERIELGMLVRLATAATRLVAHRPAEADRAVWLAGAWEPVSAQIERLMRPETALGNVHMHP